MHRITLALILAMLAVQSRADERILFSTADSRAPGLFASCAAACKALGLPFYEQSGKTSNGSCYTSEESKKNGLVVGLCYPVSKSCDLKDIKGSGTNGTHNVLFNGMDDINKVPGMVRRCINNCEVEDRRVKKQGEAAGSDYGGSLCFEILGKKWCQSDYTRLQTGTVCIPNKGAKNDDTKYKPLDDSNAGDDAGNGNGDNGQGNGDDRPNVPGGDGKKQPDGRDNNQNDGQSGGGNTGGDQSGQQDGTGKDSPRDSGSADDEVEKGKPPRRGGGGGGGHKDRDKNKDGGGSDGQSDGNKGGNGGDSGNKDGEKDGGAGGKDGNSGDPNGKGEGDANSQGDGSSISGGNCDKNEAPKCKGDPVQCYIAREQWRTACLAERGGGSVKGGSCKDNKPPECKGDPTQCYIVKQQFYQGCEAARAQEERDGLKDYTDGKGSTIAEVDGSSMGDVESGLVGNSKDISLDNIIDMRGYGWSRTCPAFIDADMGKWGIFHLDNSAFCTIANLIGNLLVALSLLFGVRYMFA